MGTQQLLLIVLTVIIVAVAIAIGIYMFNYFAYRSNEQAILAEMQNFAAMSRGYWSAPASLGGASRNPDNCDIEQMAAHLDFQEDTRGRTVQINYIHISPNAEYHLEGTWNGMLEITALGVASFRGKYPWIDYTYDMMTNSPEVEISAKTGWEE